MLNEAESGQGFADWNRNTIQIRHQFSFVLQKGQILTAINSKTSSIQKCKGP